MGHFNLPSVTWNDHVPDQNITACHAMFLYLLHSWPPPVGFKNHFYLFW